jgi:hypothetical protein
MEENTYVGITLIRSFYVNDTVLMAIPTLTSHFLPSGTCQHFGQSTFTADESHSAG